MAIGTIILDVGAAMLPDGSANNAAPGIGQVKSSAGDPKPHFLKALFDATTKEMLMWGYMQMPSDYDAATDPVMHVIYSMATATTGGVVVEARVAAIVPGAAVDIDAKAFDAANTSATSTVPGTAGHTQKITMTLTANNGLAPGDLVMWYLSRVPAASGDTATGDMEVESVVVEYTQAAV